MFSNLPQLEASPQMSFGLFLQLTVVSTLNCAEAASVLVCGCYHSRVDSTQEVSFRTQTPSDPEHQGTSIFARLHPSTTSCISFPKRFSQHGTKWEKCLDPRAPKIHCIEALCQAKCVYSSNRNDDYYWWYYHDCHDNIIISPSVLNHHLQLKVKKKTKNKQKTSPFRSWSLYFNFIYAVNILKFKFFTSLSTFVQWYTFVLLIYLRVFSLYYSSVKSTSFDLVLGIFKQ